MEAFLSEFWANFTSPENIVGHIAYVLLITSMLMRNINWLRALAICAGSISAVYYWQLADYVSMFWESLFTLVNVAQLVIIYFENRRGRFTRDEDMFIKRVLPDIERAHARRLVKQGVWSEVENGAVLISEDTVPSQLQFIIEGEARITREEKAIGRVTVGDFLGEMSYLTGNKASATVVAESNVRYLAFDRERLQKHLERFPEVRHALEGSFNRNLVDKLVKTNALVEKQETS